MPQRPDHVPDLNWSPDRARHLGEAAVDIWSDLLAELAALPIDRGYKSKEVRDALARDVPDEPLGHEELVEHLREIVFDYSMYPGHPGFMAYISGSGTVPGAAAELIAAGLNQNVGGWRLSPAATEIELCVTEWFCEQFGLPTTAGGMMTAGGALANFVGLKAARDQHLGLGVRQTGVGASRAAIYASEEVHSVNDRAADMLGLGSDAVRKVAIDARFRLDVGALSEAIDRDLDDGYQPIAVVATAGTVSTGAIDPIEEIAEICGDRGLWMHVDAAYGGPAVLADDLAPRFSGIERADSIAFDPHKWLYVPHSAGCVLVRDFQHLADSFAVHATYVHEDKELTGRGIDYAMLGPQFSRGFQALKLWISLLAHGRRAYARRISHDAALARYLAAILTEREDFEVMAPVDLSICCFRYVPPGLSERDRDGYLNRLNERLMPEVQLDGRVYYSNAVLDDRFVLRACITNFRTEAEDVERVVEVTAEIGARLDREMRA